MERVDLDAARPAVSPPWMTRHAMAYDPVRRRCVFHATWLGGGASSGDTWEWDGSSWASNAVGSRPSDLIDYGFCWDGNLHRVLMFGGDFRNWGALSDTRTYGESVPAVYATAGAGCAGQNGIPALAPGTARPWIGETFTMTATGLSGIAVALLGWSDTMAGPFPLPLELTAFGMPGCRLYVSLDVQQALAPAVGRAQWSLFLPDRPSLIGLTFHQQVVTAAPGINAAGLVTSDYGSAKVGVR
ncbi:MAG: hypothetical protein IPM13_18735 [Phycisphaerales bacterium]|nr:hypothetical protein [Phycisphaerales bacterium]